MTKRNVFSSMRNRKAPVEEGHSKLVDLLITIPFIALFLVQLAHHAMWRDELNAFGIAGASPTLSSLFSHIHYEGHPWLWYVLLWIVSKATVNPLGMKALQAVIGTSIYLLIGIGSPFSRFEKLLLFFCYFISFEYTVLSRMYGVMLLLLLLYLRQRTLHPTRVVRNAFLLGLIGSTDVLGIILSVALAIEYIFFLASDQGKLLKIQSKRIIAAAMLAVVILGFSVWSAKTMPDVSWRTTGHIFSNAGSLQHLLDTTIRYVLLPYFDVRNPSTGHFWNPGAAHHQWLFLVGVLLVLVSYSIIFRSTTSLLALMGSTIFAAIAFGHLIYIGSMRHYGLTFLAFLAGLWILKAQRSHLPYLAHILLCLTAVGGIIAGVQLWVRPFSNSEAAATWLRSHHMDTSPIVGTPDTTVIGVAELLHRPIYMLDCNCSDTFVLFSNRRDSFDINQIPDRLILAARRLETQNFIYLDNEPLNAQQKHELQINGATAEPLTRFVGAENSDEDYYIYNVNIAK